jgi:hypothetical protein
MTGELFAEEAAQAEQRERDRVAEAEAVDVDLRERDADYTAMPIARACLRASMPKAIAHAALLRKPGGPAAIRVLDVGAGAGAWSKALVELYTAISGAPRSDLHVTAVEIDERERPHLERVADRVIIGDWTKAIRQNGLFSKPPEFDIAIGNPPFSELRARPGLGGELDVERSMPAQLLRVAPAVALFSRLATWSKDRPGVSVRRKYPPAFMWELPGSVRFRAPGAGAFDSKTGKFKPYGADQHSYAVFLWLRGHTGPTVTDLLPDLPAGDRRWVIRPGTEP